jgi:ragB/susD domain-containing protein
VANLDKYRMLKEWLMEFLREGRRRTDLVRWNAYVTEDWWDHKATNNKAYNRYPIHYSNLNANSLLEQNPGY